MKRLIILTVILLSATVAVTVVYFKKLNTPAAHAARVMGSIPNTAAFIFEFSNDNGFYEIFDKSNLLTGLIGKDKLTELTVLRQKLLLNPLLKGFFAGQHFYISVHGSPGNDNIDFLITTAGSENFNASQLEQLARQKNTGLVITNTNLGGKEAYTIYINDLKKRFYLADKGNHLFTGSFSKELVLQSAQYRDTGNMQNFVQIPDQENSNSLANLYIDYTRLTPLFNQFFRINDTGLLKTLRMLPANAALTLNYQPGAVMFNGLTAIQNKNTSYLTVFLDQQPVEGRLKDIFPSTTAVGASFMLSDVKKFADALERFHANAGLTKEKNALFTKVKSETGLQLKNEFDNLLAGEFAVVDTRYNEKYALIVLKNGTLMRPLMVNISKMVNDDMGQWKYDKLPYFLLGDAFAVFKHPYFCLLDNYLVLANSVNELNSFKDSYSNRKFLNKTAGYASFDNLLARHSNIAYFIHFRNIFPLLKSEMKPDFVPLFNPDTERPGKYYALSWQFSVSDGDFYTNLCMGLAKPDTTIIKKSNSQQLSN